MLKRISILLLICFSSFFYSAAQTEQTTEPIKLLSKPAAIYTLRAKKKGIEGNVILKITFLSSGEIGDIIDATEIDKKELSEYGLTDAAVTAAKKIKFVSAKRNGTPITVVKTVVYVFTLF